MIFMKKISIMLCVLLIIFTVLLSGCNVSSDIDDGVYICKTPYIKYTQNFNKKEKSNHHSMLEVQMIEIDRNIYKAFTLLEFGDIITFIEFQEEDLDISNGWNESDNKVYAQFHYEFDSKNKQLILTDEETGNVYHLDKIN